LIVPREGEATPAGKLQLELQTFFGGRPVNPVHVTCERFDLRDHQRLEEITQRLIQRAETQPPFPVTAVSVQTIKSAYRGGHILKWLVELSDPLSRWLDIVNEILDAVGARPFYNSLGDIWTVTALVGIEKIDPAPYLAQASFPQHLFTARQILFSRILGLDKHETIGRFDLLDPIWKD
jgi:hypothetical protein